MQRYFLKIALALLLLTLLSGSGSGLSETDLSHLLSRPWEGIPASHSELEELFAHYDYDWESIDHGVPPIYLEALPEDLNRITRVKTKKKVFFLSLLPLVLKANDAIHHQKHRLSSLLSRHDRDGNLSKAQRVWLASLSKYYRVKKNILEDQTARQKLLKRVDTIPPSMVLAQAAAESAYGTSRFAQLGNNIFGEWTFTPGTGLVPEGRPEGETYEVRRFSNLYESVRSYMRNLNTHRAYRALRDERVRLRDNGLPNSGHALAGGLTAYSARGDLYVDEIRAIIRSNRLHTITENTLLRCTPAENLPRQSAGLLSPSSLCSRRVAITQNP